MHCCTCLPPGQAVEWCANDTSIQADEPCLSIVYATDENFCIEPVTQEGTVVAVLHCLLAQPVSVALKEHAMARRAYRSHSALNGSTTVLYLTTTGNRSPDAPARDRITLTCKNSSAQSNQVVLNVSYCSDANQSGAPYVLGIPPSSTVQVNVGQSTHIALFNVIAKVSTTEHYVYIMHIYMNGNLPVISTKGRMAYKQIINPCTQSLWTKSGVSVSIDTLHTVHDYMEQNDTATSVTRQVPFYVGDGNVIFFNGSQSVGSDESATYSLVIAASDSETGGVTLVHSSVKVIKTLGAAAGVYILCAYVHECTER